VFRSPHIKSTTDITACNPKMKFR